MATTSIPAHYDPTKDRPIVGGRVVDPYSGWFLTSLFSVVNWMPEINVPTGVANNNVPTGLQIASRPYDESTCAAIAFAYADQMAPLPFHLLVFHNSE